MLRLFLSLFLFQFTLACGSLQLVLVDKPVPIDAPPEIDYLIDLGSLPLPEGTIINQDMADGRLTPGEWIAIVGTNLASEKTSVKIDKRDIAIAGYLEGGNLLIRMPRGFSPRRTHELSVETPMGRSTYPIDVSSYLIVNDVAADQIRFFRTSLDHEEVFEEELDNMELEYAPCQVLSPSGGLLYVIHSGESSNEYHLKSIHLGEKEFPDEISDITFQSESYPTSVAISSERKLLIVLAEQGLFVFGLSNPARPRVLEQLKLQPQKGFKKCEYRSLVILGENQWAAALDAHSNTILLFNLAVPSNPESVKSFKAAPGVKLPVSIDIAADPHDPYTLWLLKGPNTTLVYEGLKGMLKSLVSSDEKSDSGKKSSESKEDISTGRVVQLKLSNRSLHFVKQYALPTNFLPLSIRPDGKGRVLVSGASFEIFKFMDIGANLDSLKRIPGLIKDTIALGRIICVTDDGKIFTEAQGVCIFMNLGRMPEDGDFIYPVIRIGARMFPPFVGVDMGVEVYDTQLLHMRKMDWTSLLPPYISPRISMQ